MPESRSSYTNSFKLKVIKMSDDIGNRAAAKECGVNESMVRKWKRKRKDIQVEP